MNPIIFWFMCMLSIIKFDSVDELAKHATTPHRLSTILCLYFDYEADVLDGEEWLPPEITVQRRTADCEDFALLVKEVLRKNGIISIIISFRPKDRESSESYHAAVYFEYEGKDYIFSNQYFYDADYYFDIIDECEYEFSGIWFEEDVEEAQNYFWGGKDD